MDFKQSQYDKNLLQVVEKRTVKVYTITETRVVLKTNCNEAK